MPVTRLILIACVLNGIHFLHRAFFLFVIMCGIHISGKPGVARRRRWKDRSHLEKIHLHRRNGGTPELALVSEPRILVIILLIITRHWCGFFLVKSKQDRGTAFLSCFFILCTV